MSERQYFTVKECAALLRLTDQTVRAMIRSGDIKALQIGQQYRIPASGLIAMGVELEAASHHDSVSA